MDEPADEVECTALDRDWEDGRPNILMHPPCQCPKCAAPKFEPDRSSWLVVGNNAQRRRVEPAELGEKGSKLLG